MQNNKFIEKVKDYLYGSNATGYKNGEYTCLLYTSPSPRDQRGSRMASWA